MKQSSEAKKQIQLATGQLWTLIIPEFMRLSSGRGTSWHHLSCFNSGPTLRAQTQRKTLHSQGRSGTCSTCTHRQVQLGCCPKGLWGHKALDKLLSNLADKHHTTHTGQGEPPGDPQAAGRGSKSWFEWTYTWAGKNLISSLLLKKNPDQDVLLAQWQHSCQQDTYWFAWCLFACCACLLPLGINIQFYPLTWVYFVSGCTRHLTVQYASEAIIPQKTKGLMKD